MKTRLIIYTWSTRDRRQRTGKKKFSIVNILFTPTHERSREFVIRNFQSDSCHMAFWFTRNSSRYALSLSLHHWQVNGNNHAKKSFFFTNLRQSGEGRKLKIFKHKNAYKIVLAGEWGWGRWREWERIYSQHETGALDWVDVKEQENCENCARRVFLWVFERDMNYVCSRYPHFSTAQTSKFFDISFTLAFFEAFIDLFESWFLVWW